MALLTRKNSTTERIHVPPAEDFPAYAAAIRKLNQLSLQRSKLQDHIEQLRDERAGEQHRLDARARALLDGTAAPATVPTTTEKLNAARQELLVLDRAIQLQTEALNAIRRELGADVRREIAPAYGDLVRKTAEHLRAFAQANAEIKRVCGELQAAGFAGHGIEPCAVAWLDANEHDGRLAGALEPMRRAGYID